MVGVACGSVSENGFSWRKRHRCRSRLEGDAGCGRVAGEIEAGWATSAQQCKSKGGPPMITARAGVASLIDIEFGRQVTAHFHTDLLLINLRLAPSFLHFFGSRARRLC